MKKILFSVLMLMPALFFAQDVFERFERDADVTSLVVGKKAFAMMAATKFGDANEGVANLAKAAAQVESLRVYSTQVLETAGQMKVAVDRHIKTERLEELLQVKDGGKNISVLIKDGRGNTVKEILVFIDGSTKKEESVIVWVKGNFDLDQLSEMLTSKSVSGDAQKDEAKLESIKEEMQLKIQPNPTSDVFYLNTSEPSEVTLYDLSGRKVKTEAYTPAGISVVGLKPETYLVEVRSGDKKQTQKLIVK